MTKLEIIYDIREKLRIETDDEKFTNEYFSHLIDIKRMVLIKQTFSNLSKPIPIAYYSQLCLDLEIVSSIPGGCDTNVFGCTLRTKQKIPTVINITGREDLITVRSIDNLETGFNSVSIDRFPYLGRNKYLLNQIYTAINVDNKIYFFSGMNKFKLMSKVIARGVFEAPDEANKLSCIDQSCEQYGSEYPIEGYMADDIVRLIARDLGITILEIPEDEINDASNDRNKK